ncbi:MAG: DNA polymerase III subunit epsilon [Thermomonas sp.]|uniref:DNA polymerase III subunit epsilon n=1 Tax=Thermomonas sp. TaxID=1971895 RepID=UPI002606F548|nr:DNA polymerase III subunit epsilon [Thermomonas sp.]MCC7096443.1 DNA polymerase III subunit epsilon [Thermomonas sp.]
MRQIVLDTETTGLEWKSGNRVVEIGCVELLERRRSGRIFHRYLNPDRDMEPRAQEITGLTREFLSDKPRFAEVANEFLTFITGAELIIHNAAFDIGFLDAELARLDGMGRIGDRCSVEDTVLLARQRFPGQHNTLNALCKRLGVDNSQRQLHGALLDAQILVDVYIALTSGQGEIGFADESAPVGTTAGTWTGLPASVGSAALRPRVLVSEDEVAAHVARLAQLQGKAGRCLWLESEAAETSQDGKAPARLEEG